MSDRTADRNFRSAVLSRSQPFSGLLSKVDLCQIEAVEFVEDGGIEDPALVDAHFADVAVGRDLLQRTPLPVEYADLVVLQRTLSAVDQFLEVVYPVIGRVDLPVGGVEVGKSHDLLPAVEIRACEPAYGDLFGNTAADLFFQIGETALHKVLECSIIIGFQVRPSQAARRLAEREEIDIRLYSIIYDAIEELKSAMEGMLSPEIKEEITATLEILQVFKISKVGSVAGCLVREGKIKRTNKVRLIRDGIVIYTGELGSLRRVKDDVKEVSAGLECGLNIAGYNDIKTGDLIESFEEIEVKKTL